MAIWFQSESLVFPRGGSVDDVNRQLSWPSSTRYFVFSFFFALAWFCLRSHNAVVYPILHFEDGNLMFAYFRNNTEFSSIFRFYAGYVSLLPNLVGYLTARLPAMVTPYAMTLFATSMAALAYSLFSLPQYRVYVRSDRVRTLVCLMAILMPIANHALFTNLTYSLWHILIVATLLLCAPLPASLPLKMLLTGVLALMLASHPLSVVVVPILAFHLWKAELLSDKLSYVLLQLVIFGYLTWGVEAKTGHTELELADVVNWVAYYKDRVIFESLLGNVFRVDLLTAGRAGMISAMAFVIVAMFVFSARRLALSRQYKCLLAYFLLLSIGLVGLSIITRDINSTSHMGLWHGRYFYVSQVFFLLAFYSCVCQITISRKYLKVWCLGVVGYLVVLNAGNLKLFHTSPDQGKEIFKFTETVQAAERSDHIEETSLVFQRQRYWEIVICLRDCDEKRER